MYFFFLFNFSLELYTGQFDQSFVPTELQVPAVGCWTSPAACPRPRGAWWPPGAAVGPGCAWPGGGTVRLGQPRHSDIWIWWNQKTSLPTGWPDGTLLGCGLRPGTTYTLHHKASAEVDTHVDVGLHCLLRHVWRTTKPWCRLPLCPKGRHCRQSSWWRQPGVPRWRWVESWSTVMCVNSWVLGGVPRVSITVNC